MKTDNARIEIESPGVNVAVIKEDGDGWKFLLLQRSRQETYAGCWGFLTGAKTGNETVAQVAMREVKEETGLTPERLWATEYVMQFYEPTCDKVWILPLVVAVVKVDSQVVLSPENSDFRWLPAVKARRLVTWKNLVRAIDDLTDELEVYPARNWGEITA
jgi:dihydroneopterin triphosphate diphosphatase